MSLGRKSRLWSKTPGEAAARAEEARAAEASNTMRLRALRLAKEADDRVAKKAAAAQALAKQGPDDDEQLLARKMIDVHGALAASAAQDNVRAATLAGQRPQARHWLRVLGMIQQIQTRQLATPPMSKGFPV